MKFESADLIYQPRGIQKCNKMGGITDSTKRYDCWKKFSDEPVRCIPEGKIEAYLLFISP
jgi:hypothetical protein